MRAGGAGVRWGVMANRIELLGHASIRITGSRVIYVDPWKISGESAKADVVLVTHSHHDHCSPKDVARVSRKGTRIVAPPDCVSALGDGVTTVAPGDCVELDGPAVEVVPAYNLDMKFHPRDNGWVGYIVEMDGERIYVAGDTDAIPEMSEVQADVALLPVGGTYTMTAEEAARAANAMRPGKAIPVHYGDIVGSRSDAERFAELCEVKTEVIL